MTTPIHITATGLSCQSGDQPFALLGAVATNLSGAIPDQRLDTFDLRTEEAASPLFAPIAALGDIERPQMRMRILAQSALAQVAKALPADCEWDKLLVLTLIPDRHTPRTLSSEDLSALQRELLGRCKELARAEFRFVPIGAGATAQLQRVCEELSRGERQAVLFGGVDSLVDLVSCTQLLREGRAMTTHSADGTLPGEGAAYVLLQPAGVRQAPLAEIVGLGYGSEPHAGCALDKRTTALLVASQAALAGTQLKPTDMQAVVSPHDGSLSATLEWHQAVERLFPRREGAPRDFEEFFLHRTLGETGAAALPLALVLGCARFEFTHPPVRHVMVCETGDQVARGAVMLRAPALTMTNETAEK